MQKKEELWSRKEKVEEEGITKQKKQMRKKDSMRNKNFFFTRCQSKENNVQCVYEYRLSLCKYFNKKDRGWFKEFKLR